MPSAPLGRRRKTRTQKHTSVNDKKKKTRSKRSAPTVYIQPQSHRSLKPYYKLEEYDLYNVNIPKSNSIDIVPRISYGYHKNIEKLDNEIKGLYKKRQTDINTYNNASKNLTNDKTDIRLDFNISTVNEMPS